jgi:hypothetical protein
MKKVIRLTESELIHVVRRIISEQETTTVKTDTPTVEDLSQELGSNIDPNIANEVMSCSFDEIGTGLKLKPEAKELLDNVKMKIKELVSNKDRDGLKNAFKQLKSRVTKTEQTEVNEQAAALAGSFALLGVTAPLWAWIAVGGIVLILLIKGIVNLTSWIPRKKGKGCSRVITYRVRR